MADLRLENVVKQYGRVKAINGLNLEVPDGKLVTILGPSGCGKTTTLRCLSGFLVPEYGRIFVGGKDVTEIPPERRGIGMVFQNYALWPHMTVYKNLAFGLQLRKIHKAAIKSKVEQVLATVRLSGYEDRYPRELSGGQQQRVALARALVLEPEILLLDEPLSNLDAILREQMRFELAQLQKRFGITTIYVTHDQTEAMVISDTVVLMNEGRSMQQGSPADIYRNPANKFVAGFMGMTNFLEAQIVEALNGFAKVRTTDGLELVVEQSVIPDQSDVCIMIRPEHIAFLNETNDPRENEEHNICDARVTRATYLGGTVDYELTIGEHRIRTLGDTQPRYQVNQEVRVRLDSEQMRLVCN